MGVSYEQAQAYCRVIGGGAVSYERGAPVTQDAEDPGHVAEYVARVVRELHRAQ